MKLNQVLKENEFSKDLKRTLKEQRGGRLNFNDLSPMQVAAIRGIADGRVDFENASDKMLDVMDELQDLGVLNQQYELTGMGQKAAELAQKHGSLEKRKAQQRVQQRGKVSPDEEDDFEGDYGDDEDDFPVADRASEYGRKDDQGEEEEEDEYEEEPRRSFSAR